MSRAADLEAIAAAMDRGDQAEARRLVRRLVLDAKRQARSHEKVTAKRRAARPARIGLRRPLEPVVQQDRIPVRVERGYAHPPLPTELRVALDKQRMDRGLTVAALARQIEFSNTHVHAVLTGRKAPSVTCAAALLEALGSRPGDALHDDVLEHSAHGVGRDRA